MRYAFPCLKPVGQVILGIDALAGAQAPSLTHNCGNGLVRLRAANGDAKVSLDYVLGMTSDIYAIRGDLSGVNWPVSLRLYRHRDTTHLMYMTPDGTSYTTPEAEADKSFNGPMDPPTSGNEGRFFWIRQQMPPEKTFPQGFEYVLMGVVTTPGNVKPESVEGKTHLGTPPRNQPLNGEWKNVMRPAIAECARRRRDGELFARGRWKTRGVCHRGYHDGWPGHRGAGKETTDRSRTRRLRRRAAGKHPVVARFLRPAGKRTGLLRFHRSAAERRHPRSLPELDLRSRRGNQDGHAPVRGQRIICLAGAGFSGVGQRPCYNEIFHTSRFVRNWGDSVDMYKQLLWHWLPGAKQNARDLCGMPGMFISHGYLPPVKPDKYVHTTITLELCLGTMAQLVRPVWDEWDYGGDVRFLRDECYPLLREMALFYAAYAEKGSDGYYHVIPSMEVERWGIYPEFSRNKDVISSLCMFRWGLTRAADAAEFLGVDPELRQQWRQIARQIAPYPTWNKPEGVIFAGMPGVEPRHLPEDHFGDAAAYPTILADEINLDSPQSQRDMMIRSVRTLRSGSTGAALLLLGEPEDSPVAARRIAGRDAEALLNSRSGRIHLFPAVASSAEVAFRHFQARGGFLVSAAKNADGVYFVEIQPRRNNRCYLMNPWPGRAAAVHEVGKTDHVSVEVDHQNGECLIFAAVADHQYLVESQ